LATRGVKVEGSLIDYIPDEFKLDYIGNLAKLTMDEAWLLRFAAKYPAEFEAFKQKLNRE